MKVKFKNPFYHATRGLIPRKRDDVGQVIEIDDALIHEIPLSDVEIIDAEPNVHKAYAKRQKKRLEDTELAKATAKLKDATKQTDLLITLINSLSGKDAAKKQVPVEAGIEE